MDAKTVLKKAGAWCWENKWKLVAAGIGVAIGWACCDYAYKRGFDAADRMHMDHLAHELPEVVNKASLETWLEIRDGLVGAGASGVLPLNCKSSPFFGDVYDWSTAVLKDLEGDHAPLLAFEREYWNGKRDFLW